VTLFIRADNVDRYVGIAEFVCHFSSPVQVRPSGPCTGTSPRSWRADNHGRQFTAQPLTNQCFLWYRSPAVNFGTERASKAPARTTKRVH